MTTRPLLLLVAAASFVILPSPVSADDLLDAVLRTDSPVAQPAAMPSSAPAPAPAAIPTFSSPYAPTVPAMPEAALPPPAVDEIIGTAATTRHSLATTKPRGVPKKTFDAQLMDAFSGCCFFIRPKPPEKPAPDADEPHPRTGYLP